MRCSFPSELPGLPAAPTSWGLPSLLATMRSRRPRPQRPYASAWAGGEGSTDGAACSTACAPEVPATFMYQCAPSPHHHPHVKQTLQAACMPQGQCRMPPTQQAHPACCRLSALRRPASCPIPRPFPRLLHNAFPFLIIIRGLHCAQTVQELQQALGGGGVGARRRPAKHALLHHLLGQGLQVA
jgi:hypothetical protein